MSLFNDKLVKVCYGRVITDEKTAGRMIMEDMNGFRDINATMIGVLPYKILRVDYHVVEREVGFLDNIRGEATRILEIVRKAAKMSTQAQQMKFVYDSFNKRSADEESEEEETQTVK
jgi:hypothetical protein